MRQRGFSAPRAAEDGEGAAGRNREIHAFQDRLLPAVAEGHMAERDVAVHRGFQGARRVFFLLRGENLCHALGGDAGLAHLGQHAPQAADGPRQSRVVEHEGQKFAERDAPAHGFGDARDGHREDLQADNQVAGPPVQAQQGAQANPEARKALVQSVEPADFKALAPEGPHHPHAGQVFLHVGGKLPLRLVRRAEPPGDFEVKHARIRPDGRQKRAGDQRDFPVHRKHGAQRDRHQEDDAEHLQQLRADKLADDFHVGSAALDDFARLVPAVPGKRQLLDVLEQPVAERFDKRLRPAGNPHLPQIAAQARQGGRQQGGARRQQQRARGVGEDGCQQLPQPAGKGSAGEHRIDRNPDDLGKGRAQDGVEQRKDHRSGKKATGAPQQGPDQGGCRPLLTLFFHRIHPATGISGIKKHPRPFRIIRAGPLVKAARPALPAIFPFGLTPLLL